MGPGANVTLAPSGMMPARLEPSEQGETGGGQG